MAGKILGALNSPVLYTCSSSTIPSLPPPNTTMSSLMATARWPWRGRGTGPDQPTTRFQRGCRSTAGELAGDTAEAIVPGEGAVGKSHQAGMGALQELSHTPFRLRQLSRRSGFSHSGARLHGGRHLNYAPSLRFFPLFSFPLSPQESSETVERLSPRRWGPTSPAALTTGPGAPAYEL